MVAADQPTVPGGLQPRGAARRPGPAGLRTVFCADGDWRRAAAEVTQAGDTARQGQAHTLNAAKRIVRFLTVMHTELTFVCAHLNAGPSEPELY